MVAGVHIASGIFYGLNTCTPLWCNKKYTWFLPTSCHFSNPQDSGWLLSNEVPCGEFLVSLMVGAEHQEDQATISNLECSAPRQSSREEKRGKMESRMCPPEDDSVRTIRDGVHGASGVINVSMLRNTALHRDRHCGAQNLFDLNPTNIFNIFNLSHSHRHTR